MRIPAVVAATAATAISVPAAVRAAGTVPVAHRLSAGGRAWAAGGCSTTNSQEIEPPNIPRIFSCTRSARTARSRTGQGGIGCNESPPYATRMACSRCDKKATKRETRVGSQRQPPAKMNQGGPASRLAAKAAGTLHDKQCAIELHCVPYLRKRGR